VARNRSRRRQLQKAAERRAAERRRQRRQRILTIAVGVAVAAAGGTVAFFALTGGEGENPRSGPTTASPTPEVVACGGQVPAAAGEEKPVYDRPPEMQIDRSKTYTATMVTTCGTIRLRLDAKGSPQTVNSLVFLARKRFFDGLKFHRIVKNFVIQGGDPKGDGTGGPGYSTVDTPPKGLKYEVGDLAMAKTQAEAPGTAGSQFFIVTGDPAPLNASPVYALVGTVVEGLDVAQTIEQLPAVGGATDGVPADAVYIESVTIEER